MRIGIVNQQPRQVDRVRLRRVARAVMRAEQCHPQAELSIALGDDAWIQDLNKTYRNTEAPTDVLAFPQETNAPGEILLLGEVAISAETADRQAAKLGHSLMCELGILLAHGILHLTGWQDDIPTRRRRMMQRTREILSRLGEGGGR